MRTHGHIGSGLDHPPGPGLAARLLEKIAAALDPQHPSVKDEEAARARRIASEKHAYDLEYQPTDQDAQIDGSGARFRSDG